MRDQNRKDMPSPVAIRKYWAARLVELGKFACESEVMEAAVRSKSRGSAGGSLSLLSRIQPLTFEMG